MGTEHINEEPDFWQVHSDQYLEMAYRMDFFERIENPDGYGKRTGECGDTIEMFIGVEQEMLKSVSFMSDGCTNTRACANTLIELVKDKTLEQAWSILPEHIIDYLKTLPAEENHCAELAVGAFFLALTNYQEKVKKRH